MIRRVAPIGTSRTVLELPFGTACIVIVALALAFARGSDAQSIRELQAGEDDAFVVSVVLDSAFTIRGTRFGSAKGSRLLRGRGDDLYLLGVADDELPGTRIYRLIERSFLAGITPPRIEARFEELFEIPLVDLFDGTVAFGDMDGDGRDEIVLTGRTLDAITPQGAEYGVFTGIYHNVSLEEPDLLLDGNTGLPHLAASDLAIADFNGDDRLDVVIAGERLDGTLMLGVYLASGSGARFEPSVMSFEGLLPDTITAGDFDDDGDMDFVAGGRLGGGRSVVRLYENAGGGRFVEHADVLPDLLFSEAVFGDVDGDGDDDLILTGGRFSPALVRGETRLYYGGAGGLIEQDLALPGLFLADIGITDMDGDGDIDFFLAGAGEATDTGTHRVYIYERDGDEFLQYPPARGLIFGAATWIDYDGNGRKEIFITGGRYEERRAVIYEIDPPN